MNYYIPGRRSLKSKHPGSDSSGDEDFVPKLEEEEEEEAQDAEDDEEEESDSEFFSSTRTPSASHVGRGSVGVCFFSPTQRLKRDLRS